MRITIARDDLYKGDFIKARYHHIDDNTDIKPMLSLLYNVYNNNID